MGLSGYPYCKYGMESYALNALWLLPIALAGAALTLSRKSLQILALFHGSVQVGLWAFLYAHLPPMGGLQVRVRWFGLAEREFFYAISAHHGNLALLLLTILIGHIALLYGLSHVRRVRGFSALLYLVMGFSQGVFLAQDILLFFVFYEAALVPAFLLIYGWGGQRRREAAIKFALFTLGGSVVLIIGIILALQGVSVGLYEQWIQTGIGTLSWVLMTVGLAVKLPLVPLHSWLGEAHVEAESAISIVLAGILLKLGGYALLYWVWWHLSPSQALALRLWGGISLIYAAAVATGQTDLKRLIAFTSIGHMALVAIGAAAQHASGLQGAYHQLFTHGIISAGLFAWVGWIEKKYGSREIHTLRGAVYAPGWSAFQTAVLFFGAIGVPGMALFISELMVIWGTALGVGWRWALLPAAGLLLTAIYFLRAYRELAVPIAGHSPASFRELRLYIVLVWVLVGLSVGVGVYPGIWLDLLAHVGR